MDSKLCRRCGETKPIENFSTTAKWCRPCLTAYQRERRASNPERSRDEVYNQRLRRDLGMDLDSYKRLLDAQGGRCAICGKEAGIDNKGRPARLHVDHDHYSGEVRGLLCRGCNQGLGGFRDNTDLIRLGIAYLRRHSQ